ncbi:GDP-L-fucose synthase [Thelohanellus kitauei]|uniref:GDP-L-fucose synthase n=1 Tax=Thelohanellus kitauei TaxID=669202 RepID=A0A0C2MIR9_THEKT|nr:GDP-L-fucose synthase [Thelohanellus kitauei]
MNDYRCVLVTGGSGLVGKNLQSEVEKEFGSSEKFVFLSSKDCNLEDPKETLKLFEKYKPDCVIHLAANVGGLYKNMRGNFELLRTNMKINENILDAAVQWRVSKCISCLSTCIFPDKTEYPIDETMVHNGPPSDTNFGYSYAKRFIDIYNRYVFRLRSDLIFTSIVPCNVYGQHDNFNIEDGHVIPSLIQKAYVAKQKGQPLTVLGTGKPLRQFVYAKDLARLILLVLRDYNDGAPIILCPDEFDEISIADAAESIRKAMKIEQKLVFNPSFADGQFKKTASNKKLRKMWPDFKFTPFSVGIQETVDWFIKNYDKARK